MAKQQEDLPFRYLASILRKYQIYFLLPLIREYWKLLLAFHCIIRKLLNILSEHRIKTWGFFTSASPSGLTFLSLNFYLVKLGLFIYLFITYFFWEGYFLVQPSKETSTTSLTSSLTVRNASPSIPMPNSIWKLGPALFAATHIRNRFTAASARCLGMWRGCMKKQQRFSKHKTY